LKGAQAGFGGFGIDLEEALRTFMGAFGGGGSIFDDFFGFTTHHRGRERGADLRYDVELTLEEAAAGCAKEVSFTKLDTCPECAGSGARPGSGKTPCSACGGHGVVEQRVQGFFGWSVQRHACPHCGGSGSIVKEPCARCRGDGRIKHKRKISVKIPPGIETGSRLQMQGEGEAGAHGAHAGTLYIIVHVAEHEIFQRHGDDILCEVPLSFTAAALGGTIDIPTLTGRTQLHIPPGTQSGKTFRIRGRGMPNIEGLGHGDQYVRVAIETPVALTEEQKALLCRFAELGGDTSHPLSSSFFAKAKKIFTG
ncbi:MAG: molecular chaperone DnaJ, partial [Candidatus Aureabacteria bacterium]|nr:molecular chaperone DnaJ [Candidatus Auribacterota bacterium]